MLPFQVAGKVRPSPPEYVSLGLVFDCGDFTTYTGAGGIYDGDTPVLVSTPVLERTKNVKCPVDASKDATDYARFMWTISPTLVNRFQNDWIYFRAYFDTLAYISAGDNQFRFYLMDANSKGISWRYNKTSLAVGWNLIKCDFDNPTVKDSGFDFALVHQLWMFLIEVAGNTTDFDVYVESAFIARPLHA